VSATTGPQVSIHTPDTVQSRLGALEFRDGAPSDEMAALVYYDLDYVNGVQAFLRGIPGAALAALRPLRPSEIELL
jgi:hypothetical protein